MLLQKLDPSQQNDYHFEWKSRFRSGSIYDLDHLSELAEESDILGHIFPYLTSGASAYRVKTTIYCG